MLWIGLCGGVAIGALKHGVVVRVRVAGGANSVGVAVVHRKPRVVKRCPGPARSRMASGAGGWETGCRVIRIRGAVVIGFVARIAVRGSAGENAAHVATGARHRGVRTGQRKWRVAVIERRVQPGRGSVANRAVGRISARDVVGNAATDRSRVVVILRVASIAIRGESAGVIVRMAGSARDRGVRAGERKRRVVVVERRVQPSCCRMAQRAILREIRGHVVWYAGDVGRAVVILRVAAVAARRQRSGIVVRVAGGACDARVRARQRKRRGIVIEGRVEPRRRRMALRAILRESRGHVVRHAGDIRRAGVILHVAAVAVRRQRACVVVCVTRGARDARMRAGQRKRRLAVIERRRDPRRGVVADLALLRHSGLHVIRRCRGVVVLHVAGVAIRRSIGELPVHVAEIAGYGRVRAGQRKSRLAMIERGGSPRGRVVAGLALMRKASLRVIGIGRPVEIVHMAAVAIGWRALELSSDVARGAFERGVGAGERKAGHFQVIELRVIPRVEAVARLASAWKIQRLVIGIDRLLKIGRVARDASGRKSRELANRLTFVAIDAFQRGMRSEQRKTVFVRLDLLRVQVPAIHGVALFAFVAKLASMNIGVAIGALHADVFEDQADVALRAGNAGVHSAERVPRLIVIELWNASDRLPAGSRVAVFAGDCDRPMRIARVGFVILSGCTPLSHCHEK